MIFLTKFIRPPFCRTSAAITNYSNTTRKCNDEENERKLKYYSIYSRSNCQIEVRVDTYGAQCGCKPYYYPGEVTLINCQKIG